MKISLLLALPFFSGMVLAQDAVVGKEAYKECAACHSIKSGETLLGPSLAGVYGRKAGAVEGFRYSGPLKKSGVVWDDGNLDAYIADPQAVIPGSRMPYSGMADATTRKNLVAYLKTL
jgi:cytochrome c